MGAKEANISRDIYSELKRYQQLVYQQGKPWVDADDNDGQHIYYNLLRRFIQKIIGNGSPDNGFKIVGTGANNDFTITGGDGTVEEAGRLLVEGFQCVLPGERGYKDVDNLECTPISTDLTENMLSDSAANFTMSGADNNLAGRTLVPDIIQPGLAYTITANTQTTITVTGSMLTDGIQLGAHYRVELSTPSGSNRTDEVYIDCYLDEIDGEEDPDIKHTLGMQIETQRRLKLIQNVLVAQGGSTPAHYADSDGNNHYMLKLATIQRYNGQAAINPADVTDNRPVLGGGFWNVWQEIVTARGSESTLNDRLEAGHGSFVNADKLDGAELSTIQAEIDSDIAAHKAQASAHHSRYANSEAVSAMGGKTNGNPLNHDRYTNPEAVGAMGAKSNGNPLNHDRYTNTEAQNVANTQIATHAADSDAHHTRYANSEAVNAMGAKGNSNPLNHDRYTDTEAQNVANTQIASHASIASAHHSRYANSEAVSAMGAKANSNPLNHNRYTDAEAIAAVGGSLGPFPGFSVHKNGTDQTITAGPMTKLIWSTEVFDSNNNFDLTNNRFLPTVAGKYLLVAHVRWWNFYPEYPSVLYIYKNGGAISRIRFQKTTGWQGLHISQVAEANGSTDYFEAFVSHSSGVDQVIDGGSISTMFSGCKID